MPEIRALAAAYGVRVQVADLGDWGTTTLVAEYDPDGPTIRVDERALTAVLRQAQDDKRKTAIDRATAIELAIAHELYHHREAIGEIPRIKNRRTREAAADAFAEALVNSR
jgi:hypothetical protein